jgi:hypothetical protein
MKIGHIIEKKKNLLNEIELSTNLYGINSTLPAKYLVNQFSQRLNRLGVHLPCRVKVGLLY